MNMQLTTMLARLSSMLGLNHTERPYLMTLRSSKPYVITTVAFAVFTDLFLYGLIVAVLPFSLAPRTAIAEDNVQSWISILLAVFAGACVVASPLMGWLSERSTTRRAPYLLGGVVLAASTLMLCLGTSIPVLLVARILQGASAAAAWIVGPSLIVDTFGKSNEIGKAMGYVGLASASATVLGPVLGGVLYGAGGYYAPFGMAFGVLGLDLFFRFFLIEQSVVRRFDFPSVDTSDTEASMPDPEIKPGTPTPPAIRNSDTQPTPPPNIPQKSIWTLLKSTRLLTSTLSTLSISILLTAFDAVLALYAQETFHWSSTGAGLIYLPLMLPSLFAPLLGRYVDRYGARWSITAGFLVAVPGYACLRFVDHDGISQVALLCALLVVTGSGVAACLTPTMTEMSFAVLAQQQQQQQQGPPGPLPSATPAPGAKERGMASVYGIFNAAFATGNAVGPLWAGYVRERYGWGPMSWSLALLAGVTGLVTLVWLGGPIYARREGRVDGDGAGVGADVGDGPGADGAEKNGDV